jgi:RNA polymerase sigma-70 factor (ECF subfamily)
MSHDFQTTSLHELMDRIHMGDREAQNELIRRIAARMEELCRKMLNEFARLRPVEETGDVMQNAYLRLLRRLESYRPVNTRQFFAFAADEVRRELLDLAKYYDAGKRLPTDKAVPLQGSDDASAVPVQLSAASDTPEELERWSAFHEAAGKLPEELREVFSLIFYHECKHREVAHVLSCDERTVRRRWLNACVKLQELLGGDMPTL